MKKESVALGLAMCLVSVPVAAQGDAPLPMRFGIVAGVNSATLTNNRIRSSDDVPKRRMGLMVGGLLVVPMGTSLAVQTELLYTQKGTRFERSSYSLDYRFNYLEIPVLARFAIPVSGAMQPFVYGGPALSLKLKCDVSVKDEGEELTLSCDDEDIDANPKTTDYGVVIGGGVAMDLSGRLLTVGARYNHGLGKISHNTDSRLEHNRVLSLVVTFEFPFGR